VVTVSRDANLSLEMYRYACDLLDYQVKRQFSLPIVDLNDYGLAGKTIEHASWFVARTRKDVKSDSSSDIAMDDEAVVASMDQNATKHQALMSA
ncbi:hypothetical protein Tco_0927636, partial [Tanacetum coccineum]